MNYENAIDVLDKAPNSITIPNAIRFWFEVENAYLRKMFPSNYFTTKHIVIKKKTKKGIKEFDYIYYYEIVTRDKPDSEWRKDQGTKHNNYTKSRYIGKAEDFERMHGDSLMVTLIRNNKIEQEGRQLLIGSGTLKIILKKFPELATTEYFELLLNQIEEEITYGTTI